MVRPVNKARVENPREAGEELELSVVMPCLDEADTVATCVAKALSWMDESGVAGEVVVTDNGSSDASQDIAAGSGARVIDAPVHCYGGAILAEIDAARGRFVIMAVLVGSNAVSFAIFTRLFSIQSGLLPPKDRLVRGLRSLTLEKGPLVGTALSVIGLIGSLTSVYIWSTQSFGEFDPLTNLRIVIPSALSLAPGFQIVFASFVLSILQIPHRQGSYDAGPTEGC